MTTAEKPDRDTVIATARQRWPGDENKPTRARFIHEVLAGRMDMDGNAIEPPSA